MRTRICFPVVFSLMTFVMACSCSQSNPPQTAKVEQPKLEEFELLTSTGDSIRSQDLKGKVWVASYFFTECGSNCRMLNMEVSKLAKEFGPDGVCFVSITCDPKNDTPAKLAEYAALFKADKETWTFTTGDLDYLQRVGSDVFELSISERAHHARITLMDRSGESRGTFDILEENERKRATRLLKELIEETPST